MRTIGVFLALTIAVAAQEPKPELAIRIIAPEADTYVSGVTTLKAEIDADAWASLHSDTSRPFDKPNSGRIAVKAVNREPVFFVVHDQLLVIEKYEHPVK